MALLEIIIRPLLKAQHEAGRELGRVDGRKEGQSETEQAYQEWIRRQRAAGTKFDEDIPPPSCRK